MAELTICAINYKSKIKKKRKKRDKILLLAKAKLNGVEVLIFKTLSAHVLVTIIFLMNNVVREYDNMKEAWWHQEIGLSAVYRKF